MEKKNQSGIFNMAAIFILIFVVTFISLYVFINNKNYFTYFFMAESNEKTPDILRLVVHK